MNQTASPGHQWVWTAKTESLRGIQYPDSDVRLNGSPAGSYSATCPKSWVEKGYVREAKIEKE